MYYLTIKDGKIQLLFEDKVFAITSLEKYNELVAAIRKKVGGGIMLMKSATIDFPEDYASDPAVIALAKELQ